MSNTLNSKEALFALDTDIEDDMASYGDEVTKIAIKYINSTKPLWEKIKYETGGIKAICENWANEHKQEFGDLFITELEMVDWDKVRAMI